MNNTEIFAYSGGPGPAWLDNNAWCFQVQIGKDEADKFPRIQLRTLELKVHMCCNKCAEIVTENIREVEGVVDVKTDRNLSKVTVVGVPREPLRVLKRARKVDKNAQFWVDPPKEDKPKEADSAPKEDQKKAEGGEASTSAEEAKSSTEGEKKEGEVKAEGDQKKTEGEAKEEKAEEEGKKEESSQRVEKPKDATATQRIQYAPFEYGSYQYRPSQSYHPLYPDYYYQMHFNPQVLYTNPNYLKHVKIAY